MTAWTAGDAVQAATALLDFVKANEAALRAHMPESAEFRAWARNISDWLYSTDHITVGYGLQSDGVDIEPLSPCPRGIDLLLLSFDIDAEDAHPLPIDPTDEHLNPPST